MKKSFIRGKSSLFGGDYSRQTGAGAKSAQALSRGSMGPVSRASFPLSCAQERLWFLDQLVPASNLYNASWSLRLRGPLRLWALERALRALGQRQEVLCATYGSLGGRPTQSLALALPTLPQVVDLSSMPAARVRGAVDQLVLEIARRPFTLSCGPLFRAVLLRLGSRRSVLVLALHQILADGESGAILMRDLVTLYEAAVARVPAVLPDLPLQYVDVAVRQRRWLESPALPEHLDFWRQRLNGAPDALSLPVDRPSEGRFRARRRGLTLCASVPEGGLAPRALVAAAGSAWLARLTGQRDLILGTVVSLRDERTRDLVGQLSNLLPLRLRVELGASFRDHLARTRATVAQALEHRALPFERLAADLMPERALAPNPLCRAVISYQNSAPEPRVAGSVRFEPLRLGLLDSGSARYDLTVSLWSRDDSLEGVAEYNAEALDETTVQRWLNALSRLMRHAQEQPRASLAQLSLLSDAERHQLSYEWQGPPAAMAASQTLHQRVEQVARRSPEAVAVVGPDATLTFFELEERAGAVARWLQTLGVRPGDPVGLCMDRSAALVVGLLGLLQAGAICVPLDTASPRRRLEDGLTAASAAAVVTQERYLDRLPEGLPRLCLDLRRLVAIGRRSGVPSCGVGPAYLLGRGAGVGRPAALSHQAMLAAADELVRSNATAVAAGGRIAQLFPVTFEASVVEIWAALLTGATLEIPREEEVASPLALAEFLMRRRVSVLVTQGSWLARLVREIPAAVRRLTTILVVAEATPPEALARLAGSSVRLVELAGLAETGLLAHRQPPFLPDRLPPLGAPSGASGPRRLGPLLAGVRVFVLSRDLEQLPAGVTGELWVGAPHLSSGYPGDPRVTARRFLPDPFSATAGARLLRTGESARRLRDGTVEIQNDRVDDVVRIRGQRIDLEVVEARLERHPDVRSCALVARDFGDGRQLVAFVERETTAATGGRGSGSGAWRRAYHLAMPGDWTGGDAVAHGDASARHLLGELKRVGGRTDKVLEVGCGDGALLLRLARHSRLYHALDPSPIALRQLHRRLGDHALRPALEDGRLRLLEFGLGEVHRVPVPAKGYDLIVIGTAVTGLPSVDDLRSLLEAVLERLAPGGVVAMLDLPSLPLRPIPHTEEALRQAPDVLGAVALRNQVERSLEREEGLFLDPVLFAHPQSLIPGFNGLARVLPRPLAAGAGARFHCDVLLLPERAPALGSRIPWVDWRRGDLDLERLEALLRERSPEALGLTAIPNHRVAAGLRLVNALGMAHETILSGSLRRLWEGGADDGTHGGTADAPPLRPPASVSEAVEPEELIRRAEALGYRVDLSMLYSGGSGRFDALLRRQQDSDSAPLGPPPFPTVGPRRELNQLVSDPLTGAAGRRLRERLLSYLEARLPAPMVPEEIVLLPRLPRDAAGHVDRRRLSRPEENSRDTSDTPRRPTEALLCTLWSEVLERDEVGVDESFFDLGGHSLLATRVVARVREVFAVNLPLAALFEHPTVEELALAVDDLLVRKLEDS